MLIKMESAGGGSSATELEWFTKNLSGREVFSITTTKKAKAIYLDYIVSGYGRIHYYASADTPNDVYFGVETANAKDSNYSVTFTDSSITFSNYFSSNAISDITGVIIY